METKSLSQKIFYLGFAFFFTTGVVYNFQQKLAFGDRRTFNFSSLHINCGNENQHLNYQVKEPPLCDDLYKQQYRSF